MLSVIIGESYAQDIFFKTGKNFTTYDFKSDAGIKITDFLPGTGSSYEFGLGTVFFLEKQPDPVNQDSIPTFMSPRPSLKSRPILFRYEGSLTLDSYDSYGGDLNNSYSWETTYGGVRNRLSILGSVGALELGLSGILGASTIITGTQEVNKSMFDLREFEDFSGVFLQAGLGGSASFQMVSQGFISLSYDYSKSYRVGQQTPNQLRFKNQRIVFGIHFKFD